MEATGNVIGEYNYCTDGIRAVEMYIIMNASRLQVNMEEVFLFTASSK